MPPHKLNIRQLGLTDYETTWHAMQAFTYERNENTPDECWVTEHAPVYTLGLNRKDVRMPGRKDIPVVAVDRGGKITYHGPGQLIVYLLMDLKRKGLNIRQLVSAMENAIVSLLGDYGVTAATRPAAPGVYVQGRKIASLGLRLKNHRCYHGLALNVDMDLRPFAAIDPCGYKGLEVIQTSGLGILATQQLLTAALLEKLASNLDYTLSNMIESTT
jgi:lipoyl(octanoyl) transferase